MMLDVKNAIQSINDFWFHESAVGSRKLIVDTRDSCLDVRGSLCIVCCRHKLDDKGGTDRQVRDDRVRCLKNWTLVR